MFLFFDTETTGLPARGFGPADPRQPHLVQLACLLADEDGTERASLSLIVAPPIPIPAEAAAVHGITDEIARGAGVSQSSAVSIWAQMARRAHTLVAHNIPFDLGLLQSAWFRTRGPTADGTWADLLEGRRQFCTMRAATGPVNLPPTDRMRAAGFNRPKAPKLSECVRHFFDEDLAGAHDALVDVRACARVFFHLRSLEKAAA
jgi:DNA polymerase-3 subunit epsilon